MSDRFGAMTQAYSTWGDKLLQHCDRLWEIQCQREFRPITVQLAPTEVCECRCSYCSVQNRPLAGRIAWPLIDLGLREFAALGAKAVEITGGGNPLLYRDRDCDINSVVRLAAELKLNIGIITNSELPGKHLSTASGRLVDWIRISLAKIDEGCEVKDYDFSGFDERKIGFSYIIHRGTTEAVLEKIAQLVRLHPQIKFVRVAPDCLGDDALTTVERWGEIVDSLDPRFFIKDIGANYRPFPSGCWVGMLRPYWTSQGVYICTSHVLQHRNYHPDWRLCGAEEILPTWKRMNQRFKAGEPPYEIDLSKCKHCYYRNNNALLASVINELPDRNFA